MDTDAALELIAAQLRDDRAVLRAAVDLVPVDRRSERPAADRWSVAEVLEHVAMVEARTAAAFGAMAATAPMRPDAATAGPTLFDRGRLLDRSTKAPAPDFILPKGEMDFVAAWAALERAWCDVDALLTSAKGRDLSVIGRAHPFLGQLDGYQWLNSIGGHEVRHAAQIREIADVFLGR